VNDIIYTNNEIPKTLVNLLSNGEIVKHIPGYNDYYITNLGRVFSLKNKNKITELKHGCKNDGHVIVNLCKDGKCKSKQVHQLVLKTFVGECPDGHEVRHINGISDDNRLENLVYGTRKENGIDNIINGVSPKGSRNGKSKLIEEDVLEIRRKYKTGNYTHKQLAEEYKISRKQIGDIINMVNWGWLKEDYKLMPKLDDWIIVIQDIPIKAYMIGKIYNSSKIPDGKIINTSTLIEFNLVKNTAETEDVTYKLGNPSEEWKRWLVDNDNLLSLFV